MLETGWWAVIWPCSEQLIRGWSTSSIRSSAMSIWKRNSAPCARVLWLTLMPASDVLPNIGSITIFPVRSYSHRKRKSSRKESCRIPKEYIYIFLKILSWRYSFSRSFGDSSTFSFSAWSSVRILKWSFMDSWRYWLEMLQGSMRFPEKMLDIVFQILRLVDFRKIFFFIKRFLIIKKKNLNVLYCGYSKVPWKEQKRIPYLFNLNLRKNTECFEPTFFLLWGVNRAIVYFIGAT